MAAAIIGPCMFAAPLVFVLMLLAIPLWPVAIVALAAAWLVTWPVERVGRLTGLHRLDGAAARVARWLGIVVRPWRLFGPLPPSTPPGAGSGPPDPAP